MKTFADFNIDIPAGRSGNVRTTCPECSHQRRKSKVKCLSVDTEEGVWCCHHCGWGGTLKQGSHRHELHWQKPKYRKPKPKPETSLPEKVVEWFKGRGISVDTLNRANIGYGEAYIPQVEGWTSAIWFPYSRDGEVVNHKYRDGRKNFCMDAGAERILYGLDDLDDYGVIVEGEMDKLSLDECGLVSSVSVPDGAPSVTAESYSSKFTFLEADADKIQAVKEWIIAVDDDEPGQKLEDELARRLGREKCRRVRWPTGCKDANETLVQYGPEVLTNCIANAEPFPLNGVFEVQDLSDKIDQLYETGFEKGVSTSWVNLDQYYSVRPGEFTVVTGIPNSGKSNFVDDLCVQLAKNQGWRIAVFSPENQPLEDHMSRVIEKWASQPFNDGPTPRMDRHTLDQCKAAVNEHFSWILPDEDADWTVDEVIDRAKSLVFRKGIRGLIVDPWNELEHIRPHNITETEYISQQLKRIRQFGRKYGVHVWVIAHPQKLYKASDGSYPVPTMYDISGSAHWRNKADNGLCVWRDLSDNTSQLVEIHVQKVRFRQIGKIGMAELRYQKATATYIEV